MVSDAFRSLSPWWLCGVAAVVLAAELVFFSWAPPSQRAACDRAFVVLMEATNLVDLERSEFLLRQGNCTVARRFREYVSP